MATRRAPELHRCLRSKTIPFDNYFPYLNFCLTEPGVKFILYNINLIAEADMKATAKDLRFHSRELLNTVNRGEEVIITFHGKPCAKLIPYQDEKRIKEDKLFGIWKDNEGIQNVEEYVRNLRKGRF